MLFPVWQQDFMGVPGYIPGIAVPVLGVALFCSLVLRRLRPLLRASPAPWADRPLSRLGNVAKLGLFQARQNRYPLHALAHGLIFYGFLFSFPHLLVMVCQGFPGAQEPGGRLWPYYQALCNAAATAIIAGCCLAAFCRLGPYKDRYPRNRRASAFGILAFLTALTLSEAVYSGASLAASGSSQAYTLAGVVARLAAKASQASLNALSAWAWFGHELLFFGFMCIVPLTKQFHEILGLASLWCMRLDKGTLKPCRYGISEEATDELPYLGIASMNDCTWRQLLHFASCADCGRCSDNCPAVLAGRALSPREFTFKGRLAMEHGSPPPWTAEEIWDCAVCGACEEACPLGIGYIDVMVDLRRNAVDAGAVPPGIGRAMETLQRVSSPLAAGPALPFRPGWTEDGTACEAPAGAAGGATLYLPAAFSVYDPQARPAAEAVCRLLMNAGRDIALLPGPARDAGHEARRWGDEYLYRELRDTLKAAIRKTSPALIVTEDPHTLNALQNDYGLSIPVAHTCELLARDMAEGKIPYARTRDTRVHAFHDPCYLGRHNGVYDAPRQIMDRLGFNRVELPRHKGRSFCCGGPSSFFHEPEEKRRPACLRLEEAAAAGVAVLVTACPWCFVNFSENSRSMGATLVITDIAGLVPARERARGGISLSPA